MKKTVILLTLSLLVMFSPCLSAQNFSIKLMLGSSSVKNTTDSWRDPSGYFNTSLDSILSQDTGVELGAEFIFWFNDYFGLGAGGGYFETGLNGSIGNFNYKPETGYHGGFSYTPELKSQLIPITASVYFCYPLKHLINLKLFGGLGYYFGKVENIMDSLDFKSGTDRTATGYLPYYFKSDISTIAPHFGLGVELGLSMNTFFVVDAFYRKLSFSDFKTSLIKGGDPEPGQSGVSIHNDQTFLLERLITVNPAAGDLAYDMELLDFSGFSIRGGIEFRF